MKQITFISGGTGEEFITKAKEIISIIRFQRIGGEVNIIYYVNEHGFLMKTSFLDSDTVKIKYLE